MTQERFKELFSKVEGCDLWRYVYHHQTDKDMYYYNRGYYDYIENNNYPIEFKNYNNPYKKGTEAYADFDQGWNQAFAEDELDYSTRRYK